jgi:hypothetical protein
MKRALILFAALWVFNSLYAQQSTQLLSKTAQEGALYEANLNDDGSLSMVYGYAKKKETKYVNYTFDGSLKLLKEEESAEPNIKEKIEMPVQKYDYIYTSVGGCSSFDVLSMDLNVSKISITQTWNSKRQGYERDMKETVLGDKKTGNFKYKGYVGYFNAETGSNLVLVKEDDKSKDDVSQYKLITISLDGNVKENTIGELGKYTLVYSSLVKKNPDTEDKYSDKNLAEYDALFIFAPFKNCTANPKDYVVLMVDGNGNKIFQTNVTMPSIASVILQMVQEGKDLYFFGMTSPGEGPYYRYEFMDYSNISNPCYPDFYNYRDNQRANDITKCEPDNLIMLKMTGDKVAYITTTTAATLESKKAVPPSVKKIPKTPFTSFYIEAFEVFDNGDILVAGQRTSVVMLNKVARIAYNDLMCLHFDKQGSLKAEYYVEPQLANAKTDKVFQMQHFFVSSPDKKQAYWLMFEPEGRTGYASFWDAYNGRSTIYACFQPVIMKIDLEGVKISDPELPLGNEYLSYKSYPAIFKPNSNEVIFVGHTRKDDLLGLTKYEFK